MDSSSSAVLLSPQSLFRSRYNYFVTRDDGIMGYNARTGTFALLTPSVTAILRSDAALEGLAETDAAALVAMGFLHSGDETQQLINRFNEARQNQNLGLTIAPTLACNFTCDYCFQNAYRSDSFMSAEVQDSTIRFTKHLVRAGRKYVSLDWYGGEPLLAKAIVVTLSDRLTNAVTSSGGRVGGNRIITNGSLLTPQAVTDLTGVGIKAAQITFDGLVYHEGKTRGVINPDGGPSVILRNALNARDSMSVSFRINVSKANINDLRRITDVLNANGINETYYLSRVEDADSESGSVTLADGRRMKVDGRLSLPLVKSNSMPLSRSEYAKSELEHYRGRPEGIQEMVEKLTPRQGHFCGATNGSLYLIDPTGNISKCWVSAGVPSEAIGNVGDFSDESESHPVTQRWNEYSPFAFPTCESCKVLPLCVGGCSHPRLFRGADHPPCESIKYQIQYCVETIGGGLRVGSTGSIS